MYKCNSNSEKTTTMQVQSLEQLCVANIANTIQNAPPVMQEMIIGETTSHMRRGVRDSVKSEVMRSVTMLFPVLIPEILNDIVKSMISANTPRTNFHNEYPDLEPYIIDICTEIAENISREMEDTFTQHAYRMYSRMQRLHNHNEEEDDEEASSDEEQEDDYDSDDEEIDYGYDSH